MMQLLWKVKLEGGISLDLLFKNSVKIMLLSMY